VISRRMIPALSLVACMAAISACGGGGGGGDEGLVPGPPPPAPSFSIGGTVTGLAGTGLVLRDQSGEDLAISANGAFTFQARVGTGLTYEVSIRTQPMSDPAQHCTVSNGQGTVGSAPVTNISVQCGTRVNKFIYVPNAGSDNVSAFAIDPASGALSAIAGSPYASGVTPRTAAASRNGTSLYVANEGSASARPGISAYSIDTSTGALTAVPGSPFDLDPTLPPTAQTSLTRLLIHPSGSKLYVSTVAAGALHGVSVTASSGALMSIPGTPLTIGQGLTTGTFTFSGDVLYLPHDNHAAGSAGGISAYAVQTSGALTAIGTFATGGRIPASATLNSQGTLLFAPNAASGTLAVFRADPGGALTAVPGSPFDIGTDTVPVSVALHPTKNFLYITNAFVFSTPEESTLSAFQVDANGVLTPIPGTPYPTNGTSAMPARIHPTGKFLYVSNRFSNNIQAYAIDQTTGALANVPGSPFATGLTPSAVEIDVSGRFLFVANADSHTVSAYSIDGGTGALALIDSVPAGTAPTSIEIVGLEPL